MSFVKFIYMVLRLFLFCLVFHPFLAISQFKSEPHFGGKVGLLLNLGTHQNRIGIQVQGYYSDFFYQINASSNLTYSLNNYGGRKKYWESKTGLGAVLLWGKRNLQADFQQNVINHQSSFENGLAYAYLWYFDNASTSQRSGVWGIHHRYLSMYFENDLFAGQGKDRFRTGELQFTYRYENWKALINLNLWTGETNGATWNRTSSEKCPNGYKDLSLLPYGKTSHGILSVGVMYSWGWNQIVFAKIGLDSEQIRHIFQNRLTHDLIFLPKKIKRNTPHYPRLNENGLPVFTHNEIRKTKFYLDIGNE